MVLKLLVYKQKFKLGGGVFKGKKRLKRKTVKIGCIIYDGKSWKYKNYENEFKQMFQNSRKEKKNMIYL